MLREVWNEAPLKQEAEVFFSLAFAKCIYTWSSWPPLVQTSLGNIFHLSCSHAKSPLEIPLPSLKGTSLCLLQLSARFLLKSQVEWGKTQSRCFLTFHTKSWSQQDHKCLGWQRERDSVSPGLLVSSASNFLFICSPLSSISCSIHAY